MSSLLQQLENNEAVLLMYLAGELPDPDRAEVEQMLAGDPALRRDLAELSAAHNHVATALAQADTTTLHLSRREAAVREVARAINQAKVAAFRTAQPAAQSTPTRSRIPVWAYPVAAAALLVIGMMIFSGKHPMQAPPVDDSERLIAFVPEGPVPIIPAVTSDDSLSRLEKEYLSLRSPASEIDLFGGSDAEH